MDWLQTVLLSRIQFAFVISFHVLFPAFTVGLAWWLTFLEFRWVRTADPRWRDLYFFWQRIFAVSFGMGVVSGIVMSFQLGTNWSELTLRAGNILGPLLSYEVLTAFFLEASFLGVMLFGWGRIKPGLHLLATFMVALGTLFSTFWILSANSWLHTPAGFTLVDGVFRPRDWSQIIFNPSFPYRLTHMALAAFITTCFVVGGVGAWYLRRGKHLEAGARMLKLAVAFAAIAVPLQIAAGDAHGLNTLEHQPAKIAAIEAHWEAGPREVGVPLVLFAIPDQEAARNRAEVAIPRLGSVILTHSLDGQIPPLRDFDAKHRPPVPPVFFAFRVMVGLGVAMLVLAYASLWAWRRGGLLRSRTLLLGWNVMAPAGFVALLAGWFVTEMGRQPYVIYGFLRTSDAASEVSPWAVAASLLVYLLAYGIVFGFGGWYISKMLRRGPVPDEHQPEVSDGERTPARPLSAADVALDHDGEDRL
ncbi:MAG: cytochrome ubiquinol oxidase subunit I [Pseudoxanthomonas spadix]|nr:MAG: cytochrome ubiquinol oxidase subunit I [Pseudoxanthomonas spadix]